MSGFDIQGPEGLPVPRLIGERPGDMAPASDEPGKSFGNALTEAIAEVDKLGDEAKAKADGLARGEPVEIHELMAAMDKSEVAFNLMLEVRNKIVEAWNTLSRSV